MFVVGAKLAKMAQAVEHLQVGPALGRGWVCEAACVRACVCVCVCACAFVHGVRVEGLGRGRVPLRHGRTTTTPILPIPDPPASPQAGGDHHLKHVVYWGGGAAEAAIKVGRQLRAGGACVWSNGFEPYEFASTQAKSARHDTVQAAGPIR